MDLFGRDRRLNISTAYLMPGFAFGGSCLPKDLNALACQARKLGIATPVLDSILPSNQAHIRHGLELILATGKRRVGLLGLSFKAGTDDLRESPLVELAERLLDAGVSVRIYDSNVNLSRLLGANKAYIEQQIPHVSRLFAADLDEVLHESDCLVLGNKDSAFADVLRRARSDQVVVDLVRAVPGLASGERYKGICW
jgi:GDP-mannose 6-dehydrogenase